jgi:hypothetical protein
MDRSRGEIGDERPVPRQGALRLGHVGRLHGRFEPQTERPAGEDRIAEPLGRRQHGLRGDEPLSHVVRGGDRVVPSQQNVRQCFRIVQ